MTDEIQANDDGGTATATVTRASFDDFGSARASAPANPAMSFGRVLDVSVTMTARVGSIRKTISDVLDLAPGSIVDLEREAGEPIDLLIGDKLIARGEIVVVDDHYGVRIVEMVQD
jgi:flagellar motor switch protein FliN/FliY